MTATEPRTHELMDVVDLQPIPGEYVFCASRPMEPHTVFGVTVQAWFHCHAQRRAVGERWGGACECCGHRLRYAHVTQDADGGYHCFGRTCLDINALGEEGARKLAYSERIEQKKDSGFCATFNVPPKLWDLSRQDRPAFARLWKGRAMGRKSHGQPQWKLSVWGDSFEQCLVNCMALDNLLGVKLS